MVTILHEPYSNYSTASGRLFASRRLNPGPCRPMPGPGTKKVCRAPLPRGQQFWRPPSLHIFFLAPRAPKIIIINYVRAKRARKIAIFREIRSKVTLDQRFTIDFLRLLNVPLFFFGARACWNPLRLGTAGPQIVPPVPPSARHWGRVPCLSQMCASSLSKTSKIIIL